MKELSESAQKIVDACESLKLSITTQFVPWKQSRNAKQKQPSLNWIVTLLCNGRKIWEGDYMAGSGYCPGYRQFDESVSYHQEIERQCSTGIYHLQKIEPDFCDVIHSLVSDSDAIDHPSFLSWASDLGFSEDSIKAKDIYNACLKIGLALRNGIGEAGLAKLHKACEDY